MVFKGPDGKYIVFQFRLQPSPGLYFVRSDGSSEAKPLLLDAKNRQNVSSISPNGKWLAISEAGKGTSTDIPIAPIRVESGAAAAELSIGKPEVFLGSPANESSPAFSPDGRWLAYSSSESGSQEIYVRPFPGPGGRWQVSSGGGRLPRWSRGGRELLYQSLEQNIMAVTYSVNGDRFDAAKPRLWAPIRLQAIANNAYNYDISPDGKRLAALVADESLESRVTHLNVLVHFFDELRRLAPPAR